MGFVYLISDDEWGFFKIGLSKNDPQFRLKNLNTGNSSKLSIVNYFKTANFKKIERLLHMKYADRRVNGEWFKLTDDDILSFESECIKLDEILSNLSNSGNPFF